MDKRRTWLYLSLLLLAVLLSCPQEVQAQSADRISRFAVSATPPSDACDQAGEAGRLWQDTNADTDGVLCICRGVAGWKCSASGSGAPTSAQYLTLASDGTLSAERTFTLGFGVAGTDGGANSTYTLALDLTDAGTDPAWSAGQCRWSNEGASAAGWVCEGETADAFETRFRITDPTAERTVTWPDASGEVSLLGQTIGAASGGTGQNSSGSTGIAKVASGTWSFVTPTTVVPLTPAICQSSSASLTWNTTSSGTPAAACVTGSNTQQAYADFDQTTDECLQGSFLLPADWTGAVDVDYIWLTTATSGSVAWCTQIVCVADAETGDPSFPAQASGNCVSDAAKGTTNQFNIASDTGITATGCAASEVIYFRMCRDPDETGGQTDTVAADARLRDANLILRRTL